MTHLVNFQVGIQESIHPNAGLSTGHLSWFAENTTGWQRTLYWCKPLEKLYPRHHTLGRILPWKTGLSRRPGKEMEVEGWQEWFSPLPNLPLLLCWLLGHKKEASKQVAGTHGWKILPCSPSASADVRPYIWRWAVCLRRTLEKQAHVIPRYFQNLFIWCPTLSFK